MEKPVGKTLETEYGLEAPQATLTITTRNASGTETEYTLEVGAQVQEDGNYYLKSSKSP